jgi:transcriptional regulator with XRE-family HTH domain
VNFHRGRPSSYRPGITAAFAAYLAQDGLTEEEIAGRLGVSKTTLTTWKQIYPAFLTALTQSKEAADSLVVESLYQKAIGGDVLACKYWLTCRQPGRWREKTVLDLSIKQPKFDATKLSDIDLQIALRLVEKAKGDDDDDGDVT